MEGRVKDLLKGCFLLFGLEVVFFGSSSRCMLIEALPKSKAPRRRTVMYEKEETRKGKVGGVGWLPGMGYVVIPQISTMLFGGRQDY